VLAASVRAGSLNARLAALAAESVQRNGGDAELTSMREFDAPLYDGDLETTDGIPAGADRFRQQAGTGGRLDHRLTGVQRVDARRPQEPY
jgi:NAD(P)H-dependent FMN reductase